MYTTASTIHGVCKTAEQLETVRKKMTGENGKFWSLFWKETASV